MGLFNFNNNKQSKKTVYKIDDSIINKKESIAEGLEYEYREPELFGVNLKTWKDGVEQSLSDINPDRTDLCNVYKAMTTYDSQIIASINQRKLLTVQGEMNLYNIDGSINEEANKIIKTANGAPAEWMRSLLNYSMDAIFWGFELLYLSINKDGSIEIKKVPEANVIPHQYAIMKDAQYGNSDSNLIKYDTGKLAFSTLPISYTGDLRELGLLSACAPSFFSKCTSEWATHARKYGQPVRVLKTDNPNDANKFKASYNALKNMMTAPFFVMGKQDEFQFISDNSKGSEMYEKLNIECNNNISKIILGQTGTLDEKAYVGSAAVHESILGSIIKSDREFLESVVNKIVIPKLQLLGIIPNNVYFGLKAETKENLTEKINIIKTIADIGLKPDRDYIETTFGVKLKEEETNNNNNNINTDNTNGEDNSGNI